MGLVCLATELVTAAGPRVEDQPLKSVGWKEWAKPGREESEQKEKRLHSPQARRGAGRKGRDTGQVRA